MEEKLAGGGLLSGFFLFIKRNHIVHPLGKRIDRMPVKKIFRSCIVKKEVFGKIGDVTDRIKTDSEQT